MPSWSVASCEEVLDLQIYDQTIPGWKTTGMNDTSIYVEDGGCDGGSGCTWAVSYPWMSMTADAAFDGFVNAKIRVDTGGSGDDNAATLPSVQNTGPVTHELRWWHYSPRSYSSTATSYNSFDVVFTYECDADTLAISTQIGQWIYTLNSGDS